MKENTQVKHVNQSEDYHGLHIDFAYMTFLCHGVDDDRKSEALQKIEEHYSE
jgi:hypothetical protein